MRASLLLVRFDPESNQPIFLPEILEQNTPNYISPDVLGVGGPRTVDSLNVRRVSDFISNLICLKMAKNRLKKVEFVWHAILIDHCEVTIVCIVDFYILRKRGRISLQFNTQTFSFYELIFLRQNR